MTQLSTRPDGSGSGAPRGRFSKKRTVTGRAEGTERRFTQLGREEGKPSSLLGPRNTDRCVFSSPPVPPFGEGGIPTLGCEQSGEGKGNQTV